MELIKSTGSSVEHLAAGINYFIFPFFKFRLKLMAVEVINSASELGVWCCFNKSPDDHDKHFQSDANNPYLDMGFLTNDTEDYWR